MWTRTEKNRFGEVTKVYKEDPYTYLDGHSYRKHVYDSIPDVIYTVEYLRKDLEEAEEKAQLKGSEIEPYELWDTFETDSLGQAVRELLIRMFDDECVDFKLFLEVGDKDTCAEIPSDTYRNVRQLVQDGINKRLDNMTKTIAIQEAELSDYKDFLKSIHGAEEMFRRWKEEKMT